MMDEDDIEDDVGLVDIEQSVRRPSNKKLVVDDMSNSHRAKQDGVSEATSNYENDTFDAQTQ